MIFYEMDSSRESRYRMDQAIEFDKRHFNFGFSTPRNGAFKIPKTGWYYVYVSSSFDTQLRKNGSNLYNLSNYYRGVILARTQNMLTLQFNAGDTISVHSRKHQNWIAHHVGSIHIRFLF